MQGQVVHDIDISPDGRLLLTGGNDVRLWDLQTGILLEKIEISLQLWRVVFSQTGDMFAVTKSWGTYADEAGIFLYSTVNGRLLKRLQLPYIFPRIAFFADDTRIFARRMADCCGDVRIIDVETDESDVVHSISGNGSSMLSRQADVVYVIENGLLFDYEIANLDTEEQAYTPLDLGYVIEPTQFEDGQLAFVDQEDRVTLISSTFDIINQYTPHDAIDDAAFSPDSQILATVNDDGDLRLIDTASGDVIEKTQLSIIQQPLMAISPNGTWLATVLENRQIGIWDVQQGVWYTILTEHTSAINDLIFADDMTLYSASRDGTVREWNLTGESERIVINKPDWEIQSIAFGSSIEGTIEVAMCQRDATNDEKKGGIHLYDVATGQYYDHPNPDIQMFSVVAEDVCFDQLLERSRAITAYTVYTYSWWEEEVKSARIVPNKQGQWTSQLLWLDEYGTVEQWRLSNYDDGVWGNHETIAVHELPVTAAALMHTESIRVISAGCASLGGNAWGNGNACLGADLVITDHLALYREAYRTELIGHGSPIRDIQVSPTGDWFATASDDGTIIIWGVPFIE